MRFGPKKFDKVVLFFFAAFAVGAFFIWTFEGQFDAEVWHSNPLKRYKMVDDIIDEEVLIGQSKDSIVELLGQPLDALDTNKDLLHYNIGSPPSFSQPVREELIILFEDHLRTKPKGKKNLGRLGRFLWPCLFSGFGLWEGLWRFL